jgi:GNAT superfamily N-acetyltransferase
VSLPHPVFCQPGPMTNVVITDLTERLELAGQLFDFDDPWPEFMLQDKIADALLGHVRSVFPAYCVVATTGDGTVVARGLSIPFCAEGPGRELYPDGGWDRVLTWGFADVRAGRAATAVSALEIAIDKAYQGRGLSPRMLEALRDAARAQGHHTLVAPVRPNAKHREPRISLRTYLTRCREDGLPADPWLRVHVRAGGRIVKVAPASMLIGGSLDEWRRWTGLPFDHDGEVEVPEALVPVRCDVDHDYAVYVEPNVWIHHALGAAGAS